MRSRAILQLKQGYAKLARASGYQRKSAKPWSEGDVRGVLAYLEVSSLSLVALTNCCTSEMPWCLPYHGRLKAEAPMPVHGGWPTSGCRQVGIGLSAMSTKAASLHC